MTSSTVMVTAVEADRAPSDADAVKVYTDTASKLGGATAVITPPALITNAPAELPGVVMDQDNTVPMSGSVAVRVPTTVFAAEFSLSVRARVAAADGGSFTFKTLTVMENGDDKPPMSDAVQDKTYLKPTPLRDS